MLQAVKLPAGIADLDAGLATENQEQGQEGKGAGRSETAGTTTTSTAAAAGEIGRGASP